MARRRVAPSRAHRSPRRRRDPASNRISRADRRAAGAAVLADVSTSREPRFVSPRAGDDDAEADQDGAAEEPGSDHVLSRAGGNQGMMGRLEAAPTYVSDGRSNAGDANWLRWSASMERKSVDGPALLPRPRLPLPHRG